MGGILVFGGTGSLGRKLIERFLPSCDVAVYSRDEAKHWTIKNELATGKLSYVAKNLKCYVGDIRDKRRVKEVLELYRPRVVIVAAALKQVDTCELSPSESVLTNLIGTQNVIDSVNEIGNSNNDYLGKIKKVLFVSTDKACSPVNVYGMCKAISERVVTSQAINESSTKFLTVRYGNVLESRGSIIPLFRYQAEFSDYLTVTNSDMTRFLMTLDDSVDLIQHALENGNSGETWIPQLPAMRVGDLAQIFADRFNKQIKITGLRPGEKMNEDLINESESIRTNKIGNHYVIGPAYNAGCGITFTYHSGQTVMTREQLEDHLTNLGVLTLPLNDFPRGPSIEEIRKS